MDISPRHYEVTERSPGETMERSPDKAKVTTEKSLGEARVTTEWSPGKTMVTSERSPDNARVTTEWSAGKTMVTSERSPDKARVTTEWSPGKTMVTTERSPAKARVTRSPVEARVTSETEATSKGTKKDIEYGEPKNSCYNQSEPDMYNATNTANSIEAASSLQSYTPGVRRPPVLAKDYTIRDHHKDAFIVALTEASIKYNIYSPELINSIPQKQKQFKVS